MDKAQENRYYQNIEKKCYLIGSKSKSATSTALLIKI
jgi:hypothetical protein